MSAASGLLDQEALAWAYLLAIPRLVVPADGADAEDYRRIDQQVIVRACPGSLGMRNGAPLVTVSVDAGGPRGEKRKRWSGSGNSLAVAVQRMVQRAPRGSLPELPPEMWGFC